MIWLLALALAQPSLNLNQQPIESRLGGRRMSTTRQFAIDCYGGTACSVDGGVLRIWTADAGAAAAGGSSDFDGGYNLVQDEGVDLTKRTTLNMVGAGVTCADTAGVTTCTISGGGAGSVNTASGVASFDGGTLDTLTTVTAAWASGASAITCTPTGEEASVEGLITTVLSQAAGSFVVRAEPRNGSHWGTLPFVCIGN